MNKQFNKINYAQNCGFELFHTFGTSAENSTLNYPHNTNEFMIFYFIKGSGNIKVEGNQYDFSDGDIIILNPSEMFCCSVDKNKLHERITFHINETIIKGFPFDCSSLFIPFYDREKGFGNLISAETVKKHKINTRITEIFELVKSPTPINKLLSLCKVIEVLSELSKIINEAEKENVQICTNPLVTDVLRYLNKNFNKNISIESVAKQFYLSKSYLSHLFKEHMGISLWNYVILRRINLFNDLIKKSNSVEETSYKVGFQNYSNFFRLYKKHMNMTPAEFKKKAKNH